MFDLSEQRTGPGFPGIWHIVDKTEGGDDDVSSVAICQSGKIILRNNDGVEIHTFENTYMNPDDETLRGFDEKSKIRISFWRQSFNEIIFANLAERGQKDSGWVARRESTNHAPEIEFSHWQIVARGGEKAAHGIVQLEKVSRVITTNKKFLISGHMDRIVFSFDDGNPGPQELSGLNFANVPEGDFLRRHGYALFEYKVVETTEGIALSTELPKLYDILSYDPIIKSFNSIFGYRSLNHVAKHAGEKARIFATFNSPLLRFFQKFVPPPKAPNSNSPFMEIEKEILNFNTSSHAQDEDPDIGVWVGEPL